MPREKRKRIVHTKMDKGKVPFTGNQVASIKTQMRRARETNDPVEVAYMRAKLARTMKTSLANVDRAENGFYDRYFGWVK